METKEPSKEVRITETVIGDKTYIVEARESETATETAYVKVKRLILNNAKKRLSNIHEKPMLDAKKDRLHKSQ